MASRDCPQAARTGRPHGRLRTGSAVQAAGPRTAREPGGPSGRCGCGAVRLRWGRGVHTGGATGAALGDRCPQKDVPPRGSSFLALRPPRSPPLNVEGGHKRELSAHEEKRRLFVPTSSTPPTLMWGGAGAYLVAILPSIGGGTPCSWRAVAIFEACTGDQGAAVPRMEGGTLAGLRARRWETANAVGKCHA